MLVKSLSRDDFDKEKKNISWKTTHFYQKNLTHKISIYIVNGTTVIGYTTCLDRPQFWCGGLWRQVVLHLGQLPPSVSLNHPIYNTSGPYSATCLERPLPWWQSTMFWKTRYSWQKVGSTFRWNWICHHRKPAIWRHGIFDSQWGAIGSIVLDRNVAAVRAQRQDLQALTDDMNLWGV